MGSDLNRQIELYTVFWLLKMLNYESIKKRESEKFIISNSSSDSIEYYLREVKKIISN
jgi:hypothetical protein